MKPQAPEGQKKSCMHWSGPASLACAANYRKGYKVTVLKKRQNRRYANLWNYSIPFTQEVVEQDIQHVKDSALNLL